MTDTDLVSRAVRNAHHGHPKGVRWADALVTGLYGPLEVRP
jgi:hypothetical protein